MLLVTSVTDLSVGLIVKKLKEVWQEKHCTGIEIFETKVRLYSFAAGSPLHPADPICISLCHRRGLHGLQWKLQDAEKAPDALHCHEGCLCALLSDTFLQL